MSHLIYNPVMKIKFAFLLLMIVFSSNCIGQKLTLNELITLCGKKNWEDINQTLLFKGWTYYNSEKGDTDEYNTITWSYNKDDYNDKAEAWFYLYTFENYPNKLSYSVFNKSSFLFIQNSIVSNGFKLIDSAIEDEKVISTYSSLGFILKISNSKRKDEDWEDRSLTAYNITLIKKAGIYDLDNGKKTEYYDDDVIKAEYTLLNGKINGLLKFYDENGNLQKTTNYVNGIATGKVIEYKENGEKNAEYSMSNDMKNGLLTFYENDKISFTTNYKNDIKSGQFTNYFYDDKNGKLVLKEYGNYLNDEKNGTWRTFYIDGKNEKQLAFKNYLKDLKEGVFQEVKGDSLIVGNYKEDVLHGNYKVYLDISRMLIGGIINTDISKLTLIEEGQYDNGDKSGNWRNYDMTGSLIGESYYANNSPNGEWKYYYSNISNNDGKPEEYSKKIFLVENYSNGKLNGKSTRFSFLEDIKYPCNELDENGIKLDSCVKKIFHKFLETSYYKDDELHGMYELRDSIGQLVSKGKYFNDVKVDEWLQSDLITNAEQNPYRLFRKGKYVNDKREGRWIEYYQENKIEIESNYKNDELDGEFVEYNQFSRPSYIKKFDNGKLKLLIVNDSLGLKKINKYEIIQTNESRIKCVETKYLTDKLVSQEYWLKNDNVNHQFFEIDFLIKTSNLSDGSNGYKDGVYTVSTLNNEPQIIGKYYKENKIGTWTYFFYDQKAKIEIEYVDDKNVSERYLNIDGTLFAGEFEFVNNDNHTKEIRKVKEGLRNGKTLIIGVCSINCVKY